MSNSLHTFGCFEEIVHGSLENISNLIIWICNLNDCKLWELCENKSFEDIQVKKVEIISHELPALSIDLIIPV